MRARGGRRLQRALTVDDLRRAARRTLPAAIHDLISGGHEDEITLARNRHGWDRVTLLPRATSDAGDPDLRQTILGRSYASPVMLAPCSFTRMCDPKAEVAVARAASSRDVAYVVPGGSSHPPGRVAAEVPSTRWYQMYMREDRGHDEALLRELAEAGYEVLCLTVDTPVKPYRERDIRNGIDVPMRLTPAVLRAGLSRPAWAARFALGDPEGEGRGRAALAAYRRFGATIAALRRVSAEDLAWARRNWSGQLVVKGVLRPQDVRPLADLGIDGIVVSNHGGRNLDGTPATVDVLESVVAAARGELEVLVDGGIRRGASVAKAVALGASAVLVGRPYLYGLAVGGEAGVAHVVDVLHRELRQVLQMLGVSSVSELAPEHTGRTPGPANE